MAKRIEYRVLWPTHIDETYATEAEAIERAKAIIAGKADVGEPYEPSDVQVYAIFRSGTEDSDMRIM